MHVVLPFRERDDRMADWFPPVSNIAELLVSELVGILFAHPGSERSVQAEYGDGPPTDP